MTLRNGQVLASRYRLERQIAVGGMGEVWEAADTRLDRQVAVKVLKAELSGDEEFRYRFHTEARLTASLNHPGIAHVHDYGETAVEQDGRAASQDIAYLVMELVAGDPLSAVLARHHRLSPDRTLDILEQAAEALQAAHDRGLVHRDIKPGNILITPAGKVKLTDFGIAKAVDAAPVTRQGMVMGTAHYIAPEQAAGDEAGPASDVYSLAVVGYECLAGQRPFHADSAVTVAMMHIQETPPPLPPDVPAPVRALIEAALVKDPRRRYGSGGEFAAAVNAVRAGHWPPMPAAMSGTAETAVIDQYPHTALLPPGSRTGPTTRPATPRTALYSEPPSGYRTPPPDRRHGSGRRPATAILVALLVVLGLVLGGYLLRELVNSTSVNPEAGTGAPPEQTTEPPPPEPTSEPEPTAEPDPETPEPTIDPPVLVPQPGTVFVIQTDYWGKPGDEAADVLRDRGLEPQVVDGDGDEVEEDDLSECRVTSADPAFGWLPPGSTIQLTCEEDL